MSHPMFPTPLKLDLNRPLAMSVQGKYSGVPYLLPRSEVKVIEEVEDLSLDREPMSPITPPNTPVCTNDLPTKIDKFKTMDEILNENPINHPPMEQSSPKQKRKAFELDFEEDKSDSDSGSVIVNPDLCAPLDLLSFSRDCKRIKNMYSLYYCMEGSNLVSPQILQKLKNRIQHNLHILL
jgi:hypothetical protein